MLKKNLLVLCFSRDAKLLVPAKNIGSVIRDLGYIKTVSCNATGTKVSFIAIKVRCTDSTIGMFLVASKPLSSELTNVGVVS